MITGTYRSIYSSGHCRSPPPSSKWPGRDKVCPHYTCWGHISFWPVSELVWRLLINFVNKKCSLVNFRWLRRYHFEILWTKILWLIIYSYVKDGWMHYIFNLLFALNVFYFMWINLFLYYVLEIDTLYEYFIRYSIFKKHGIKSEVCEFDIQILFCSLCAISYFRKAIDFGPFFSSVCFYTYVMILVKYDICHLYQVYLCSISYLVWHWTLKSLFL